MILEPRLTSFGITSSPVISKPSVQNQQSTNCTTPSSNCQPSPGIISPVLHPTCMKSKKSNSSSQATADSSKNGVSHSIDLTNGEKDVCIEHIKYDTVRLSASYSILFT